MEPIRKARNRTRLVISKPARPAAGSPLKLPGSALALCILSPHSSRRRIAAGAKRCAPIAAGSGKPGGFPAALTIGPPPPRPAPPEALAHVPALAPAGTGGARRGRVQIELP